MNLAELVGKLDTEQKNKLRKALKEDQEKETLSETEKILVKAESAGLIQERFENHPYMKVSYKGTGKLVNRTMVPKNWNVKVYSTGTVSSTNKEILDSLAVI